MDKDKTVWAGILGSFIRVALTFIGSRLLAKGLISQELLDRLLTEGTAQILGYALVGVAILWSLRNKIIGFVKMRVALLSPPKTSAAEVDTAVSEIPLTEKIAIATTSNDVERSQLPGASSGGYAPTNS
jgi:hypothetical protein